MQERIRRFNATLETRVLRHAVIAANPYTRWFSSGSFSAKQARAFLVQFSVFSNQFLLAQLHKMLNAETLLEMRASKEILANEIGVGFRNGSADGGELGAAEGSVEGGTLHFRAAHFELLVRMARQFGLAFSDLGKRRFGTAATLCFCDDNYTTATAASWAVENWAASGFWDELVEGWRRYGARHGIEPFDIGFFTWHARLEGNHARHTDEEVEEFLGRCDVDEDLFVASAEAMLDGVLVFWRGLALQREETEESHHVA